MPSKSRNKKNKKKELQKSNSKPEAVVSSLNVDAVEFVPSACLTGQDDKKSVSSLLPDNTQNHDTSESEISSSFVPTQGQDNASFALSTDQIDETHHPDTRNYENQYDVVPEPSHDFTYPVATGGDGGSSFSLAGQQYIPPAFSSTDQMQNCCNAATTLFHCQVIAPIPIILEDHRIMCSESIYRVARDMFLPVDKWDKEQVNNSKFQPLFNNSASGLTTSCLLEHNQLLCNTALIPQNLSESAFVVLEDTIWENQSMDSLRNEHNITANEYAWETSSFANADLQSCSTGTTTSYQPDNNQLYFNTEFLPKDSKVSVITLTEGNFADGQAIDSTLINEDNIKINEEARKTSSVADTDRDTWVNQPNSQLDFTNIATGSMASCLQDHNQVIVKQEHLPENPKDLAIVMPEDIANEGQAIGSMLKNEDNNNEMETNNNEMVTEHAVSSKEKNHGDEAAQNAVPIFPKNTKKKKRSCINKAVFSKKEHVNVVFVGHVDAGKSTIGGQLMWLTGMVDKRTMEKYKKEAKEKSRDSWYISWALDTNQEERDKGKTVETGRGHFETESKHFTILDAPGHKSFAPSMICGAAQADIAVLVLSARQNEFESGFDKGGQTRDHAMLVKLAGVKVLIALVNKMDDPTVKWSEERYIYCRDKTVPFLKKLGFASNDVYFLPVSGQTGEGLIKAIPTGICPWFKGPSLIECFNNLSPIERDNESPFVMPIVEKFKDKGTVVMGKIEAGTTHITNNLLLMPNKVTVSVDKIWSDDKEVTLAKAGENVKLKLKGIEEEEIYPGFVLCDNLKPITTAKVFDAKLHILDFKSVICSGFTAMMHTQCAVEEVEVIKLICLVDPKTNEKSMRGKLRFVKGSDEVILRMQCSRLICLTIYKEFAKLGKFTLIADNKVFAFGTVLKIIQ